MLLRAVLASAMLALTLQPAVAQSPWVAPTGSGTPAYNTLPTDIRLINPQPNVLWSLLTQRFTGGPGRMNSADFAHSSSDGGQTWNTAYIDIASIAGPNPPAGYRVADMAAWDGQTAWLQEYDLASSANKLLRTTTGPAGFVEISNSLPRFTAIHFFSATVGVGVAASAGGVGTWPIYRTTDGGATWSLVAAAPAVAGSIGESVTAKQNIGNNLWLTTDQRTLLRTLDAGLTWTSAASPGKVTFENASTGLAYGQGASGPELFRTVNGGTTWAPVVFSGQPLLGAVTAVPGLAGTYFSGGYTVSRGIVTGVSAVSRDGGSSWRVLTTDTTPFAQMIAGNSSEVWTVTNEEYYRQGSAIFRFQTTALAAKNALGTASVVAYPNPTTGLLRLEGAMQGTETVLVYDVRGRLCQSAEVSERARTINLLGQPAGIYHLRLSAADGTIRNLRINKTE